MAFHLIRPCLCLIACTSFALAADADSESTPPGSNPSGSATRSSISPADRHAEARTHDTVKDRAERQRNERAGNEADAPTGNPGTSPATNPGNPGISATRNGTSSTGATGTTAPGANGTAGGTGGIESGGSGR